MIQKKGIDETEVKRILSKFKREDIASLFEVSLNSVSSWKNGKASMSKATYMVLTLIEIGVLNIDGTLKESTHNVEK